MSLFDYALELSRAEADRCHGSEISAPEHTAFIHNLHNDLKEEADYSLAPITAASNADKSHEDLHKNH